MGRALIMLATCLVVSVAMAVTLWRFFRRLNQIEMQVWGGHLDPQGLRAAWERRRQRRAAHAGTGRQKVERSA